MFCRLFMVHGVQPPDTISRLAYWRRRDNKSKWKLTHEGRIKQMGFEFTSKDRKKRDQFQYLVIFAGFHNNLNTSRPRSSIVWLVWSFARIARFLVGSDDHGHYLGRLCRFAWVWCSVLSVCLFVSSITQKRMIPECSNLIQGMFLRYSKWYAFGVKRSNVKVTGSISPFCILEPRFIDIR